MKAETRVGLQQGAPKIVGKPARREAWNRSFPSTFRESMALLPP